MASSRDALECVFTSPHIGQPDGLKRKKKGVRLVSQKAAECGDDYLRCDDSASAVDSTQRGGRSRELNGSESRRADA